MTGRFVDFDAARAEREEETLTLRAYGKTFELPGSMSAALLLDLLRMEEENGHDAEVSVRDAVGLLRRALPASVLDELLAADDFMAEDFVELASMVLRAYSAGDQGEAPAPNREERRRQSRPPARRGSSPASSKGRKTSPAKASPGP
jgi:hypothetical protein